MSLHREDKFEELPPFEKTRKHRRDLRVRANTRKRSCTRKTRFHSEEHTKACCRAHGYRAYYCALCNGWHVTSKD